MRDDLLPRLLRDLAAKERLHIALNDSREGWALAELLTFYGVKFKRIRAGSARPPQERSSCARRGHP